MSLGKKSRRFALLLGLLPATALAQDLTIGVRGGPEGLDPHFSALGSHAQAAKHIFDTLVWSDEDLQPKPWLATSWRTVDDTTWEFKLRPGVKFHDGSDFTAEDVKFSIERVPEATGPTSTLIYVKRISAIEIVDPLTVRFKTDGPAPTLPLDLIRVFIVSSKAAKGLKGEAFNNPSVAVGTGPYKFVSWRLKDDMVLERFDQYWGGPSHWRRVVMKEITVDPSRVAALKSGQIDIMNYVPSVDVEWMQKDRAISVFKGPSVYVFNLQPDQRENAPHLSDLQGRPLDKNPFRDVRVREAISLAIDRKTMAERVLDGMAEPANQLLAPGMFGFNARMTPAAYDPDRARRLLAEAGYPQGFQVQLHCTNDRLPGDDKVCAALGQMMARVGIRTAVNAITRTVYFPAQARREYSFFMNGWGTLTGEASYTVGSLLHSKDDKVQLGTFNRTDYANPALDQIIQRASRTLDDGERKRLFERAMEIGIAEDRAIIPVVNLATVWAGRADRVTYKPRQDEDTLAYFVQPKR